MGGGGAEVQSRVVGGKTEREPPPAALCQVRLLAPCPHGRPSAYRHPTPASACAHWCSIWKLRCPLNQSLKKDCSTLQVAASCGEKGVEWLGAEAQRDSSPFHEAQPSPGLTALPRFPTGTSRSSRPASPARLWASQWKDTGSPREGQDSAGPTGQPRSWARGPGLRGLPPRQPALAALTWLLNQSR